MLRSCAGEPLPLSAGVSREGGPAVNINERAALPEAQRDGAESFGTQDGIEFFQLFLEGAGTQARRCEQTAGLQAFLLQDNMVYCFRKNPLERIADFYLF